MVHIEKGREPDELIQDKRKGITDYDSLSPTAKGAIYKSLLAEQHYLCAYCMRRINEDSIQVEHYIAQHPADHNYDAGLTINYSNMLGVCPGNKGHRKKELTCDQHRGNDPLTVDPLKIESIQTIKYSSDGTIHSEDSNIDRDLCEVLNLNLNCAGVQLKDNRKAALDALKVYLSKQFGARSPAKSQLTSILDHYNNVGSQKEYIGILNFYLQRRINSAKSLRTP